MRFELLGFSQKAGLILLMVTLSTAFIRVLEILESSVKICEQLSGCMQNKSKNY